MTALIFILGLAALLAGAELLVSSAAKVSERAGLSPLVVGLTVVAFATSTPELAIAVRAAFAGGATAAVGVGNVIGSNIANILLIFGLTAAVAPVVVRRRLIRVEIPVMVAISVAVYLLCLNGRLGTLEGLLMVGGLTGYTGWMLIQGRRPAVPPPPERDTENGGAGEGGSPVQGVGRLDGDRQASRDGFTASLNGTPPLPRTAVFRIPLWLQDTAAIVAGIVMLTAGAHWTVESATTLAHALGLGELVVGLTVVAVGTSLPELAATVVAALRGEREMAVGNIIGSNIINLLGVLGLTAVLAPGGLPIPPAALHFDLPVMIVVAAACLPIFFTGHAVDRWEGWLFLGYYAAYTTYLLMAAHSHAALGPFSVVMAFFVLPLTAVTVAVTVVHQITYSRRPGRD